MDATRLSSEALCSGKSGVVIQGQAGSRTSFALLQNSIPILKRVKIENNSLEILADSVLSITSSPSFFETKTFVLPPIQPTQTYFIDNVDLIFDSNLFARLTEAERGCLDLSLKQGERILAKWTSPIELLARNQWSGLAEFPENVAAFVQPNDPAVDRLLGQAVHNLRQLDKSAAFDGYKRGKTAAWQQIAAIWQTLAAESIAYILPPADFELLGQKIRNPSQILESHLGTCLDTSILFASCLEQCGLNPLLIFIAGHAFTGCWLASSAFTTCEVDDISALRKRIHLREIISFETTLITQDKAVNFTEASAAGEANLRDDNSFHSLIDIKRARAQRILPLASGEDATLRQSASSFKSPELIQAPDIFFDTPPADLETDVSAPEQTLAPKDRLDRWQRKLLDLSLRNSLLNFRSTKRHIEMIVPAPGELEDCLAAGEKFGFLSGPTLLAGDPRSFELHQARHQEDILNVLASEMVNKKQIISSLTPEELNARLVNLYRSARSAIEEGGANTLYLVFGFLAWKPDKRDKPCRAPLVLIPARLERRSIQSGFVLSLSDDEPRFNLTLLELLRKDYGITKLDALGRDLPTDNSGLDIDGIWRLVQTVVKDIPEWEVSRTVSLGLFSFAKYLMWKDLVDNTDQLKRNPVVKHLLTREGTFGQAASFLEPDDLDEKLPPQQVYCPLLADSSQLSAVAGAAANQDFVLIGPPGTGKSQTIANMIAQTLADNKTVLFVAEKTAALNVVYRRLKAINLDGLCLELHSNKANKAEVLAQLRNSLIEAKSVSGEEWNSQAQRLTQRRNQLNNYVKQLHHRYPNGLTIYQALGTVIKNSLSPHIRLEWPTPDQHDLQGRELLFDLIDRVERLLPEVNDLIDSNLSRLGRHDWSHLWEDKLGQAAHEVKNTLNQLAGCECEVVETGGPALNELPLASLPALRKILAALPGAYGQDLRFVLTSEAGNILNELKQTGSIIDAYRQARNRLVQHLRQPEPEPSSPVREEELKAIVSDLPVRRSRLGQINTARLGRYEAKINALDSEGPELLVKMVQKHPDLFIAAWALALNPNRLEICSRIKKGLTLLDQFNRKAKEPASPYRPRALDLDFGFLRQEWERGQTAWWPKGFFLKRKVRGLLRAACTGEPALDCLIDINILSELREINDLIAGLNDLQEASSNVWKGLASDHDDVEVYLQFADALWTTLVQFQKDDQVLKNAAEHLKQYLYVAENLKNTLAQLSASPGILLTFRSAVKKLLESENYRLEPDGSLINAWQKWLATLGEYLNWVPKLGELAGSLDKLDGLEPAEVSALCEDIISHKSRLNSYCSLSRLLAEAGRLGLQSITDGLIKGEIRLGQGRMVLETNYARWWLPRVVDQAEALRSFLSVEHEGVIKDYRAIDDAMRELTSQAIRSRLRSASLLTSGSPEEWTVIQRETVKKKRHMPVRQLINRIPSLLPKLTPCLLMSPLSIAQYLPAGENLFDLVIFDEASQIPVWDAIGAMARGERVVIVGDPKQLPPTNFFQKADDEEADDDVLDDQDLESVLDECLGSGLPTRKLRWHYRSRHESLITFSNHQYYSGELVTFPSPDTEDKAVSFDFAGGCYERGTSRTNPIEAKAVVDDMLAGFKSPSFLADPQSVGVVTFNAQQQLLIEDMLEAARKGDPSLEQFFDDNLPEPVIVKNLENIQGDERDIMYLSIGFGPDAAGHMTMNFGALNKEGGERRLNVAVTRARRALKIYASFQPENIILSKTNARGVHDLRLFLEFAQVGFRALAAATKAGLGEFESPFEEAVAEALRRRGWQIHPQVGVSSFRIDLGVVDPNCPGRYLAGIECDGYTYHRSATARDRDRLRESVLCGLGWNIVRIWSTEWWRDAEVAANRLSSKLRTIQESSLKPVDQPGPDDLAASVEGLQKVTSRQEIPNQKLAETPQTTGQADDLEQERIRQLVLALVEKSSPLHADALCRETARQLGLARAGSRIRAMVLSLAGEMFEQTTEDVGNFFWKKGQSTNLCSVFRKREESATINVNEIALPELAALARTIKAKPEDDRAVLLARKLGLSRLASSTRQRLEKAWQLR